MTATRRVLVMTPFVPARDATHGGGRITAEFLHHLAAKHRVALLALRDESEPPVGSELRAVADRVAEVERRAVGLSPRRLAKEPGRALAFMRRDPDWVVAAEVAEARRALRKLVAEWRPDILQLEMQALARYATAVDDSIPTIVVQHDAATDGYGEAAGPWARHARRTFPRLDAVVVFSEADRQRAEAAGARSVHVIRPGIDLPPVAPPAGGEGVLFVGSFTHEPNVDAARRLAEVIHPRVRAARPHVKLTIVGADPPAGLGTREGVVVTGRVPDVSPYVDAAAVVTAPVSVGSGVRIKVLDALARGKALVATQLAIDGLDVRDDVHLLVRDDDDEFAAAIVRLLDDDGARARLGAAAREWAEANLSWETTLAAYDRLYSGLQR